MSHKKITYTTHSNYRCIRISVVVEAQLKFKYYSNTGFYVGDLWFGKRLRKMQLLLFFTALTHKL